MSAYIPKLVMELIEDTDVSVTVTSETDPEDSNIEYICYLVGGFHIIEELKLFPLENTKALLAVDMFDNEEEVKSLKDLAEINRNWWLEQKYQLNDYIHPFPEWVDLLVEHGLIRTANVTEYVVA